MVVVDYLMPIIDIGVFFQFEVAAVFLTKLTFLLIASETLRKTTVVCRPILAMAAFVKGSLFA